MKAWVAASPRSRARVAGAFYLLNIVAGSLAAVFAARNATYGRVGILVATACYLAVTALFYYLFQPVSRNLSMLAAGFSLAGCAVGVLGAFHLVPSRLNALVFFGGYCVLIGYLILRSIFLPPILGILMLFAGMGWLTFLSASLASHLSPYNLAPGILGEGVLTIWLLVVGLNDQRWKAQARA